MGSRQEFVKSTLQQEKRENTTPGFVLIKVPRKKKD
jgi:hypothetical protein